MLRAIAFTIFGILLTILCVFLVLQSGQINVAAAQKWDLLDSILGWTARRAIVVSAQDLSIREVKLEGEALNSALQHYSSMCIICHGAPGVEELSFIEKGMNPKPPSMSSERVQSFSDRELFWIIKNGIRASGMPAFGTVDEDEELWNIVGAIRQMPNLSDEQKALVRNNAPKILTAEKEHHHSHGEEGQ